MKKVFADTHYWIAVVNPHDPWRRMAVAARREIGSVRIVTTDAVLSEFLGAVGKSALSRAAASTLVMQMLTDPDVEVIPHSRTLFIEAIGLYGTRLDKTYSLVDCFSMQLMRSMKIDDILTNDHHFTQEGFHVLIRSYS